MCKYWRCTSSRSDYTPVKAVNCHPVDMHSNPTETSMSCWRHERLQHVQQSVKTRGHEWCATKSLTLYRRTWALKQGGLRHWKTVKTFFTFFRILGSFCYFKIAIETLHYQGWQNSEEADRAMAQPIQILVRLAYELALPIFWPVTFISLTVWRRVSALVSINEVNLRRAWLVLRWVTVSGVQSPVPENLSQYITSHPGELSLTIPPWVGIMSTSQRAVMLCSWGVKAGIVHEWVAGKTVWSPCYHRPYLSALEMGSSHNSTLYKCCCMYIVCIVFFGVH